MEKKFEKVTKFCEPFINCYADFEKSLFTRYWLPKGMLDCEQENVGLWSQIIQQKKLELQKHVGLSGVGLACFYCILIWNNIIDQFLTVFNTQSE